MSIIFATSFEDYADGEQSLLDNGWSGPIVPGLGQRVSVVSGVSRTGSKSAMLGDDLTIAPFPAVIDTPQSIWRTLAPSGQAVTAEAYFRKPVGTPTGAQTQPAGGGLGLYYDDGSENAYQFFGRLGVGQHNDVALQQTSPFNVLSTVSGVLSNNEPPVWDSLKLAVKMSTVNAELDGVNADGCINCWVNGVQVVALQGVQVWVTSTGWPSSLNYPPDRLQIFGAVWCDDVVVTDDTFTCGGVVALPRNDSAPCCGSGPDPTDPNPSSTPNPGNPPVPLQPWTPQCAGGGEAPSAADVNDAEVWTL